MNNKTLTIVVLGQGFLTLVVLAVFGFVLLRGNQPAPQPAPVVVNDSLAIIRTKSAGNPLRHNFAAFYHQWAKTVAAVDLISSTEQHRRAVNISLRAGIQAEYLKNEGFGLHVDAVITNAIGLDNRSLDDNTRAKLVNALNAIADAFEGK